jgi:hypothetical protein
MDQICPRCGGVKKSNRGKLCHSCACSLSLKKKERENKNRLSDIAKRIHRNKYIIANVRAKKRITLPKIWK